MSLASPDVSIVIRACDEERALPATLVAIAKQSYPGTVEVVLVDAGSTDATVRIAERAGARVVHLGRRFSPGLASNTGFEAARAPICVLLSAAAFPADREWLARLVAPLDGGSDTLAATFSRQVPVPDASPIEEGFLSMAFGTTTTTVAYSSTSGAIRRAIWERHRFEETFPAGGPDDREWFDRVVRGGYASRYVPESIVHRSHGYSLGQWYHRVWADAAGERMIVARGGAGHAPTRSPLVLAMTTLMGLVGDRRLPEMLRYFGVAPVLALARWRGATGRNPSRFPGIINALDQFDRRIFAPVERGQRAVGAFLDTYWAQPGSEGDE
jgi:glycosyltransferase involved in cell wall biosynthesis